MKINCDIDRLGTSPTLESDMIETEGPTLPATADVDETPRYIRYGAAILLGLVLGVGCYVWSVGAHVPMKETQARHAAYTNVGKRAAVYATIGSECIDANLSGKRGCE